jgi:predicted nucleotide-binding protein
MADQLTEILGDLVSAHEAAPTDDRDEFVATAAATSRTLLLGHPGLPPDHPGIYEGDLQQLAEHGWIRVTTRGRGLTRFELTTSGIEAFYAARQSFGSVTPQGGHGKPMSPQTPKPTNVPVGTRLLNIRRLREGLQQVQVLRELVGIGIRSEPFVTWHQRVQQALLALFGPGPYNARFVGISFAAPRTPWPTSPGSAKPGPPNDQAAFKQGLEQAESLLKDALEEVAAVDAEAEQTSSIASGIRRPGTGSDSRRVFVVHGHDNEAKQTVARTLQKLGLEEVILHEQPSGGKTIIEKLESEGADARFAVVILTPDDVGGPVLDRDNLQPRARQNVILELGYFVGKLGRGNVCALLRGKLELPSDIVGVVYVTMDDGGGWRLELAREIAAARIQVDLHGLIGRPT